MASKPLCSGSLNKCWGKWSDQAVPYSIRGLDAQCCPNYGGSRSIRPCSTVQHWTYRPDCRNNRKVSERSCQWIKVNAKKKKRRRELLPSNFLASARCPTQQDFRRCHLVLNGKMRTVLTFVPVVACPTVTARPKLSRAGFYLTCGTAAHGFLDRGSCRSSNTFDSRSQESCN